MPQSIIIPLTRGQHAIIDAADLHLVEGYKWYAARGSRGVTWYAEAYVRGSSRDRKRSVKIHQLILPAPEGLMVDHIDGNGLNNRRSNLRLVNHRQNTHNTGLKQNNKSGYIGVFFDANINGWRATIRDNNKKVWIGVFNSPEDAARARDYEVRQRRGEHGRLNFPDDDPNLPPPPSRTFDPSKQERDSHGRYKKRWAE